MVSEWSATKPMALPSTSSAAAIRVGEASRILRREAPMPSRSAGPWPPPPMLVREDTKPVRLEKSRPPRKSAVRSKKSITTWGLKASTQPMRRSKKPSMPAVAELPKRSMSAVMIGSTLDWTTSTSSVKRRAT